MNKVDELKKKYDKIVKNSLDVNRNIIIESFVEYYGEEYRDIIIKKYNEIVFIYYIDFDTMDEIIKTYKNVIEKPDNYDDIKSFAQQNPLYLDIDNNNYIKSSAQQNPIHLVIDKSNNHNEFESSTNIMEEFIGTTDSSIFSDVRIVDFLSKFSRIKSSNGLYLMTDDMRRVVVFPILVKVDNIIIHEINHAISSEILAFISGESGKNQLEKSGIIINDEQYSIGEMLNEIMAQEVMAIFHRRGGNFSSFASDFIILSDRNEYLIEEFYQTFKPNIKKAFITENKNLLVQKVGKENLEKLEKLISKYEMVKRFGEESVWNLQKSIKEVINTMQMHASSSQELTKEELPNYYQELRNQGYKVTPIDRGNIKK